MWCVRKAAAGFYLDQVQWRLESGGWLLAGHSQGKADGTLTFAANCHQNCCRSQAAAAVTRLKPLHQDQDPSLLSSRCPAQWQLVPTWRPLLISTLVKSIFLLLAAAKLRLCPPSRGAARPSPPPRHHCLPSSLFWDSSVLLYVGSSRAEAGYVPSPGQHTQYTWPIFYECCL